MLPSRETDLVFFWRAQKYQSRKDVGAGSRRRLLLRRWHGPGLLVAIEGRHGTEIAANCFVSFRGQLTKCPVEHVRKASSLESIAAGSWEAAIDEVINAARREAEAKAAQEESPVEDTEEELIPAGSAPASLPSLQPSEIVAALQPPGLPSAPPGSSAPPFSAVGPTPDLPGT